MHEESHQSHRARQAGSSGTHALGAGTRIDNAEIVSLIGSSPAAAVYLAQEAATGRRIALREYMPHGLASRARDGVIRPSGEQEAAVYAAGLRSFINEALVLSRLSAPSLLSFDRYSELNGTAYAFMPFHEGSTLDSAVAEHDFTPDETWIRMLVARLLDAAEAVQRAQSCHGNIQPGNILIRRDGTPLLLEFDAAQSTIGEIIHTPTGILATGYAAMEQHFNARNRDIGAWTDIYGIGATAYFLVTGHPPPYAMQRLANEGMLPALHSARSSHSRGLLAAIGRALAIHPEHRFQTAAEMRAALNADPQIVMPAAPSILRADNARAAVQAHRETLAGAARERTDTGIGIGTGAAAQVLPTQINPAAMQPAPAPRSETQLQAHALPALPDNWRKPMPADGYRVGRSRKPGRSALWASGLMLLAGVGVGVGAGYLHFVADGEAPQAEAAEGKRQENGPAPDKEALAALAAAPMPVTAAPASPSKKPAVPAAPPAAATAANGTGAQTPAPATATASATERVNASTSLPATSAPPTTSAVATAATAAAAPPPPLAAKAQPPAPQAASGGDPAKDAARLAAQDQEQWRIASYVDQPVSYETYLSRYPNGRYADAARDKLASLRRPAAAAEAPERPAAPVAAANNPATTITPAPTVSASSASGTSGISASRTDRPDSRVSAGDDDTAAPAPAPATVAAGSSGNAGAGRVIRLDGQTMTGSFTADPSTGVVSGTGRIEWSNGDRFDGTLVRGSKEGKGQFVWRSGQRYSGDWASNEPNGKGTIVFSNGNRYDGEVRNGLPNGKGTLVFADKTRYEGDVRSGVPSGKGTMIFPDGTRYEGDIRNGMPHGQGVTRFRNGDVYVGAVAQGRSNGHGRFSWSSGAAWEGEFRDGQRTDNGRMLTAMSRSAMSSGGSAGGTADGGPTGVGRDEIVTKQ